MPPTSECDNTTRSLPLIPLCLCKTAYYLLPAVLCGRTTSSQKPTVATGCPLALSSSWTPGGAVLRALWPATSSRTHMSSTSPCWMASANPGTGPLPPALRAAPPPPPAPSLLPLPLKVGPVGVWYLCNVAPAMLCYAPKCVVPCMPVPYVTPCVVPCVPPPCLHICTESHEGTHRKPHRDSTQWEGARRVLRGLHRRNAEGTPSGVWKGGSPGGEGGGTPRSIFVILCNFAFDP